MYINQGDDINGIYQRGMAALGANGNYEQSRNGQVIVFPTPVMTIYHDPTRRVLFDGKRNANPFFHLYESLWMLAGRDDVAALNVYISDFGTRFAEKDGRVHGAYGHRWRRSLGYDQLDAIVDKLSKNSNDRQCVLQMWDAAEHVVGGSDDLLGEWKDRPCNTHIYFRLRREARGRPSEEGTQEYIPYLDLTVCCRSNDVVYGAYGANAVHFSVLLEYMAARLDVNVGRMYQFSNNFHGYLDVLKRLSTGSNTGGGTTYEELGIEPSPMVGDPITFDVDLGVFMQWCDARDHKIDIAYPSNPWFENTARPMMASWWLYKSGMKREALHMAQTIKALDWRIACVNWFENRKKAAQA